MNKANTIMHELIKKLNNQKLINGFMVDGDNIQLQALDGTMIILKIKKVGDAE